MGPPRFHFHQLELDKQCWFHLQALLFDIRLPHIDNRSWPVLKSKPFPFEILQYWTTRTTPRLLIFWLNKHCNCAQSCNLHLPTNICNRLRLQQPENISPLVVLSFPSRSQFARRSPFEQSTRCLTQNNQKPAHQEHTNTGRW